MKLLFTHRYFWPDSPPYAAMLRTIARHFAGEGHDVHVFASQPSYGKVGRAPARDAVDGIQIRRIRVFREEKSNPLARVANVLIYCAALFAEILRVRPDVVTASTFPPVIASWTASLAAKLVDAKFVYHMQDVHPEVSVYSGGRRGRGLPLKTMRALDNATLRRADAIVVLSQDMANTLSRRKLGPLPVRTINNFQLANFTGVDTPAPELVKQPGMKRFIFAGNLGRFQNLDVLVDGIVQALEAHPNAELFLLGDGEAKAGLQARFGRHAQVRFAPFLPYAQAESLIADADIGLVSLTKDIYNVSYPSKVLTYIGLGLPMLALVEPDSQLARQIEENGLGAVPKEATPAAVADAADRLFAGVTDRRAVRDYHLAKCAEGKVLEQWDKLLSVFKYGGQAR